MSESESDDCSQSAEEWLAEELFEYCKSDNISEESIREIIESHKESTPDNNHEVCDYDFFRAACHNEKVTEGIIGCLLEYYPDAALIVVVDDGRLPLHYACENSNVSLGIIRLLIDAAPDSVRHEESTGNLPLHRLCGNTNLDEATALQILKLLLEKHPESVRHETNDGHLPIHFAACHMTKSPEFCRVLIEAYPGSERIADGRGMLPFHYACVNNTVAIVEYLYNLYPDSIEETATGGFYPIHTAIGALTTVDRADPGAVVDIVKFLLSCDPNVKFQEVVQGESLLHYACRCDYGPSNKIVALGIIKAIYDAYPEFIREEDNNGKLPLHRLCGYKDLDDTTGLEMLKLLLKIYPESIQHTSGGHLPIHIAIGASKSPEFCRMLIEAYPGSERIVGPIGMLPIHYACMQNTVETVEYLYNLYPDSIEQTASNSFYPIHLAVAGAMVKSTANPISGAAVDIVKFLLRCDPNVKFQDLQSQSLLAYAVSLEYEANIEDALEIINVICDANPDFIRKEDNDGQLPLHKLCANRSRDETTTVAILKLLLEKYPGSIRHEENGGHLPIHRAVISKSSEFCSVLIDAYPGSERIAGQMGVLPIICACLKNSVDTVEFLYNLYPDAIHQAAEELYPIHAAIRSVIEREANREAAVDIVKFLLDCDPRVTFQKAGGIVPNLAFVCYLDFNDTNIGAGLEIAKAIYDADPEAIGDEELASDLHTRHPQIQAFIISQLVYFYQAKDEHAMTAPDEYGQLPLHIALQNNVRLGSIKLLVKGNPHAVESPDNSGALPLHVACLCHESTSVVQYLIELDATTLEAVDEVNDTPLHYACCGARYETIALLLEKYDAVSVSRRNAEGKLPIEVLWESVEDVDRDSVEYTECLFRLLRAYPETV